MPTVNEYLDARNRGHVPEGATAAALAAVPKAHDYHVFRPCPKIGDRWVRYIGRGEHGVYQRIEFTITELFWDPATVAFPPIVNDAGQPMGTVTISAPISDRGQREPVVCDRQGNYILATMTDRDACFPADWVFRPATSKVHNRGYFHPPDTEWSETELRFVPKAPSNGKAKA